MLKSVLSVSLLSVSFVRKTALEKKNRWLLRIRVLWIFFLLSFCISRICIGDYLAEHSDTGRRTGRGQHGLSGRVRANRWVTYEWQMMQQCLEQFLLTDHGANWTKRKDESVFSKVSAFFLFFPLSCQWHNSLRQLGTNDLIQIKWPHTDM